VVAKQLLKSGFDDITDAVHGIAGVDNERGPPGKFGIINALVSGAD